MGVEACLISLFHLDSVGSALQLVLLAPPFLVSDIPKGAKWVRGLVTANWKSMKASRPWTSMSPGSSDTWLGSLLSPKWALLVPARRVCLVYLFFLSCQHARANHRYKLTTLTLTRKDSHRFSWPIHKTSRALSPRGLHRQLHLLPPGTMQAASFKWTKKHVYQCALPPLVGI